MRTDIAHHGHCQQPGVRGLARVELLVLLSALAMLVSMAAGPGRALQPANSTDRCTDNLRRIGQASAFVAATDNRGIPHRQSTAGMTSSRGQGSFDWGGSDGVDPQYSPNCLPGNPCITAQTRPYNAFLDPAASNVYRCPADTGAVNVPHPNYIPEPISLPYNPYLHSVAGASGTSYQGDFIWYSPSATQAYRMGSFMRPVQLFPVPAETLLFYESRFAQAFLSTTEAVNAGGFPGTWPTTIESWHRDNKFNALLVDGHVQRIELNMTGSMFDYLSYPADLYPGRSNMYRGPGWRYDAFPEELIIENIQGDPLPANVATTALTLRRSPERSAQ